MSAPIWADFRWSRGASLLAIGVFGLIAGLARGSPGAVALGLALIAAPVAVSLLLRTSIKGARLTWVAPVSASEGDRVSVTIILENRSRIPLFFARVTELFAPESLGATKAVEFAGRLDRGRRAQQTYFGTCLRSRGIYPHGPMVLEASDPFEWFTVRRRLQQITEFKIYPRLRKTTLPEKLFASLSQPDSKSRTVRLTDSDEFFSVRDYLPGDPKRHIHWPLTARRDFPVVREFLPSVQQAIVLFLDASRQLRLSGTRLSNFESSVRFAASLGARVIRAGLPFELRCGSGGTFDVAGGNARGQFRRLLETLLRLRTRTDDSFETTLRRRTGSLPRNATVVVVLHPYLVGDPGFSGAVVRLVKRGFRVACVVYQIRSEAYGPESLARRTAYLRRLSSAGVELWNDAGAPLLRARRAVAT